MDSIHEDVTRHLNGVTVLMQSDGWLPLWDSLKKWALIEVCEAPEHSRHSVRCAGQMARAGHH